MSADRNRSESWAAEYAARSTRWSMNPEEAQAAGLDNVEFVDRDTLRVTKPPTSPAKPRDLFGQRVPALLESDVLPSILAALRVHPKVAWAERMNTGGTKFGDQYVRFGWRGMADITGQMRDGRRLEVEAKRVGENATDDQAAFLDTVRRNGGTAFVARGVADVMRELA